MGKESARSSGKQARALSPEQRKFLKAQGHGLKPVVMIGIQGLTDAVVQESERALAAHELIKIRVLGDDREARKAYLDGLCTALGAAPVQHIGKLLLLYRPAEKPKLKLP
jgi:RNA-binding protein